MRQWIQLMCLSVMLAATACGPGTSSTFPTGHSAAVGTPTAMSSSPTAIANTSLSTPDASGQYHNLTLAQAQQLAPFHLVQPTWVPPYLQAEGISASMTNSPEVQPGTPATNATPPTGPVQVVSMNYMGPWPKPPAVTITEVKQGTPLELSWNPSTIVGTTTITIAGHAVTNTGRAIVAVYPPPGPDAAYVWTDQGTTFQLTAIQGGEITDQDIEHVIASMLGQGDVPELSSAALAEVGGR